MVTLTEEDERKSSYTENIWKIPGMNTAWNYTKVTYNIIKDSNSANDAINSVKQTAQTTLEHATPITGSVAKCLINSIWINNAKDFSTQMAKDAYNFSWEKATQLPDVCYTLYRPISTKVGQIAVNDVVPMLYNRQGINDIWSMIMTRCIQSTFGDLNTRQRMFPKLEAKFLFIPFPGMRMQMNFSVSCDIQEFTERMTYLGL